MSSVSHSHLFYIILLVTAYWSAIFTLHKCKLSSLLLCCHLGNINFLWSPNLGSAFNIMSYAFLLNIVTFYSWPESSVGRDKIPNLPSLNSTVYYLIASLWSEHVVYLSSPQKIYILDKVEENSQDFNPSHLEWPNLMSEILLSHLGCLWFKCQRLWGDI